MLFSLLTMELEHISIIYLTDPLFMMQQFEAVASFTTTNNAAYHDMFQKFHILKSCSKKSTPKTKKDTPPIIKQFLQTHILHHPSVIFS